MIMHIKKGKESLIHNHPCDGCFVKCLKGCLKETRYTVHESTSEIRLKEIKFYIEGQVSFMSDDLGLHKIGNPNRDFGSVSLHLYTPPYKSCKVWNQPGATLNDSYEGKIGYFTLKGYRTPNLEGRPGHYLRVLNELRERVEVKL